MKIDLHMHTTISDGTDTPEVIIGKVCEAGLDIFSITDHDAYKAGFIVPPMLEAGGYKERPAFIRGVEFSCEDEQGKYHILGYGYDPAVPGIGEVVEAGHQLRMSKTIERIQFLKDEFGMEFSDDEIKELLARDNPGKPHIANLMIAHGYVDNKPDAFNNYINKKKFEVDHIRPEVAIEGILKSRGIPVLAHPSYADGDGLIVGVEMDERLRHLMKFGIAGVEAFYSGFTPRLQAEILGFAVKYDLYVTAGSDYHGRNKMIEIGETNMTEDTVIPAGMNRFLEDVDMI